MSRESHNAGEQQMKQGEVILLPNRVAADAEEQRPKSLRGLLSELKLARQEIKNRGLSFFEERRLLRTLHESQTKELAVVLEHRENLLRQSLGAAQEVTQEALKHWVDKNLAQQRSDAVLIDVQLENNHKDALLRLQSDFLARIDKLGEENLTYIEGRKHEIDSNPRLGEKAKRELLADLDVRDNALLKQYRKLQQQYLDDEIRLFAPPQK